MEMSADYLEKTVAHLESAGYAVTRSHDTAQHEARTLFDRTRYHCLRNAHDHIILEFLAYPNGSEAYFLEIVRMGAIHSFSFPLDSWKFRPSSIEFKYYIHPESGLGLSFFLSL
jgi:hypothetical protein